MTKSMWYNGNNIWLTPVGCSTKRILYAYRLGRDNIIISIISPLDTGSRQRQQHKMANSAKCSIQKEAYTMIYMDHQILIN